jgi:23S rRNA pseudouridine2604 synthase
VRVNKCFRAFASRREADRFVEEGRVRVNGVIATTGDRVCPGDVVELDGRPVAWEELQAELLPLPPPGGAAALGGSAGVALAAAGGAARGAAAASAAGDAAPLPLEERFLYLKYWKPRGVVCTSDTRVAGNLTDAVGADAADSAGAGRVFCVGRLDKDSTGLLLLTNDGRVPNAVLRASTKHAKVYRVTAHAHVSDAHIAELAAGVVITTTAQRDGGAARPLTARTRPCGVARDGRDGGRTLLFTLREGRNRQIRKMLAALGYDTLALQRLRFMGIDLSGLRPGEWRPLNEAEMGDVRRAVRAASAAAAAVAAGQRAERDDAEEESDE